MVPQQMMRRRLTLGDSQAASPEGSEDDEARSPRSPLSNDESDREPTARSPTELGRRMESVRGGRVRVLRTLLGRSSGGIRWIWCIESELCEKGWEERKERRALWWRLCRERGCWCFVAGSVAVGGWVGIGGCRDQSCSYYTYTYKEKGSKSMEFTMDSLLVPPWFGFQASK